MTAECPLCAGDGFLVFVEREGVPIHQNFPLATPDEARAMGRGDLRLACCKTCGFVTNLAFREQLLRYGEGYENDQTFSPAFGRHVDDLVSRLVEGGVRGKLVVEVGCGQGQFLRRLCRAGDNRGLGFDPSYTGPEAVDDGRVRFVREFYGHGKSPEFADVVLCRHVIEHVHRPLDLLRDVRRGLGESRPAMLAFETPALEWILDGTVTQDLFYEHCSYFTEESLRFALERGGFSDVKVARVFGQQYLWATARHEPGGVFEPSAPAPAPTLRAVQAYASNERDRVETLRRALLRLGGSGKVAVWGAGAKGVTFVNLVDPARKGVDCVVDVNPRKQGKFVPGTAHPIVGPDALAERAVRHVIVMNPNYIEEIRRQAGPNVDLYAESDL